jgi:hypothetical protein
VYGDGRSGSGQRKGLDEGAAAHGFSLQSIYMEAPALPGISGSAAMERRDGTRAASRVEGRVLVGRERTMHANR